ncbi:MAG: carboxymuconolactone decarboxylase family protein [Pedobacter sp.]|nr:carboxymuconolactone decarboxylase family protein [Pedobacter sp.]
MKELMPEQGWMHLSHVRLSAPAVAERGLLFRSLSGFSRLFGRAEMPDVLTVLHLNPRLFWAWLFFASRLMPYGRLPATEREKIILRTGWNCRSRYEWGQHVDIALGAGVTDEEIRCVAEGPAAWSEPRARALMLACDEVHRDKCIAEATWQILAAHYSEKLLIEIVMLIGHYEMIAGFLNSSGIALEPAMEEKLQAFHRRLGLG